MVKLILENSRVQINRLNDEGLTPLDIAVMTNNIPIAKTLLQYSARESPLFEKLADRSSKLDGLVTAAQKCVVELSAAILNQSNGSNTVTQQRDNERKLNHWEFRHKLLKRMKAGYDHARVPDPPSYASLSVSSSSSLMVKFDEPLNHNGAVVTKYKVEWSCFEDFVPLAGEAVVDNMKQLEYEICDLTKGNMYFVRVSARNMKGYSQSQITKPPCSAPSDWKDVEGVLVSYLDKKQSMLEDLFVKVKQLRPSGASELKDFGTIESPQQRKKKTLKDLFTSSPKFQKILKRGVYLMSLLYNEDRILATSDEQLPIVLVDDNLTSGSVLKHLHWLMKISCNWDDVKCFVQDIEKSTSAGIWHTRSKLLQAVLTLQNSLGVTDLGKFYHQPLYGDNFVVLTTVCKIPSTKHLNPSKWLSVPRLKTCTGLFIDSSLARITPHIPGMLTYSESSLLPLKKGLYIGYIQLQVSVEVIKILVPCKYPNMFPNKRVRSYPNISREEWEWLQSLKKDGIEYSQHCQDFQQQIKMAAQVLFERLGIQDGDTHRLYDVQPIEVSDEITMLVIVPPVENVCIRPSQDLYSKDFMFLPVKIFEMIHMCTYRKFLLRQYCRVSTLLEIDYNLAQQYARQAFSSEELATGKARVENLAKLQSCIDETWKGVRWVMDVITYARDKSLTKFISLSKLIQTSHANDIVDYAFPQVSNHISVGKDNRKIAIFYDPTQEQTEENLKTNQADKTTEKANQGDKKLHLNTREIANQTNKISSAINSLGSDRVTPSLDNKHSKNSASVERQYSDQEYTKTDSDQHNITGDSVKTNVKSIFCQQHNSNLSGQHDPAKTRQLESEFIVSIQHSMKTQADDKGGQVLSSTGQLETMSAGQLEPDISSAGHLEIDVTDQGSVSSAAGILQVYAAYNTGLSRGTRVTLHVTRKTTAREVVNLVVRQLNKAAIMKGKPAYSDSQLGNFCLVAVIGARERILRDDYVPLHLKDPWTRGKLYVRLKNNLLAAIQQGHATVV